MESDILQFLIQLPILAVFIWWMNKQNARWDAHSKEQNARWDENNKQWREYLTERNGKFEKALGVVGEAINRNTTSMEHMHERLKNKIND